MRDAYGRFCRGLFGLPTRSPTFSRLRAFFAINVPNQLLTIGVKMSSSVALIAPMVAAFRPAGRTIVARGCAEPLGSVNLMILFIYLVFARRADGLFADIASALRARN